MAQSIGGALGEGIREFGGETETALHESIFNLRASARERVGATLRYPGAVAWTSAKTTARVGALLGLKVLKGLASIPFIPAFRR